MFNFQEETHVSINPPPHRHLMVKGSTTSGQLDIFMLGNGNAFEEAAYSQMYPPAIGIWWSRAVLHRVSFIYAICSFAVHLMER